MVFTVDQAILVAAGLAFWTSMDFSVHFDFYFFWQGFLDVMEKRNQVYGGFAIYFEFNF